MADSLDGSWAVSQGPSGVWSYRASALGSCARALHAERSGMAPINSVFDRYKGEGGIFTLGNLAEEQIETEMRAKGWTFSRQQEEVVLDFGGAQVVGHTDGVGYDGDGDYLMEYKNMGESTLAKFNRNGIDDFDRYKWQISAYMHATDLPCMFVVKPREGGELRSRLIEEPPYSLAEIRKRIMRIEATVESHATPPACMEPKMFPCPFLYLHDDADPTPRMEENYMVDVLASQYDEAREAEKTAKARKDDLNSKLRIELQGVDKVATIAWSVGVATSERISYDTKALEQRYPEIAAELRKTTPISTLRVVRKGK